MLSLVIPVYNLSSEIDRTVFGLKNFFEASGIKDFEIIFVDDGSTDDTIEKIKLHSDNATVKLISHGINKGKGAAVKTGILSSKGEYIIFIDADLPYDPAIITVFLEKFKLGYEVVCGSRSLKGSKAYYNNSFIRNIGSKAFSVLANSVLVKPMGDTQCGIKGFLSGAAKNIFEKSRISGYAFDVETILAAQKNNYKFALVSVNQTHNAKTSIKLLDIFKMFLDLLMLRFR